MLHRGWEVYNMTACVWRENQDGYWETGCGNVFVLGDGTPPENKMVYCCYCGAPLQELLYQEPLVSDDS